MGEARAVRELSSRGSSLAPIEIPSISQKRKLPQDKEESPKKIQKNDEIPDNELALVDFPAYKRRIASRIEQAKKNQ